MSDRKQEYQGEIYEGLDIQATAFWNPQLRHWTRSYGIIARNNETVCEPGGDGTAYESAAAALQHAIEMGRGWIDQNMHSGCFVTGTYISADNGEWRGVFRAYLDGAAIPVQPFISTHKDPGEAARTALAAGKKVLDAKNVPVLVGTSHYQMATLKDREMALKCISEIGGNTTIFEGKFPAAQKIAALKGGGGFANK